jgi:hypothetical protein
LQKNLLFILIIYGNFAFTQSVTPILIASDGNHSTTSAGSVSWAIGEPVSDTYSTGSYVTTKGFYQPKKILLTYIPEVKSNGDIFTYPNPVINDVTLNFSQMESGNYSLEIFETSGKKVGQLNFNIDASSTNEKIPMAYFSEGVYLFKVVNELNAKSKIFKVIKQK